MHSKKVRRRLDVKHAFEHAQVMLQNTPRIGVPGIPDARGEVETCAPWSELKICTRSCWGFVSGSPRTRHKHEWG